jgi:hypothetical protein
MILSHLVSLILESVMILFINYMEETIMAKAGMRRPDPSEPHGTESNHKMHLQKNDQEPVPEIQGKAKAGHHKAAVYESHKNGI